MLTLDKVYRAGYALREVARRTDVIYAPKLRPGADIYLKTENLQVTGSFKLRGAYYKMTTLTEEEKAKGVIACSAGNHAQGVALAAKKNGIKAVICLPAGAPISKVEATRSYGAEVCLVPGVYDDAYARALQLRDECGYTFIHPFDDPDVIAGQGTIALELADQLSDLDAVIVPIGGGGLISGIAFTIKSINPKVKVYGVQAAGAPSMFNSFKVGSLEALSSVATFADGIAVKRPGDLTYEIVSKYVDDIVTVTDDEISAAILALMEQHKLVTEGAGAVSVAAAMFGKVDVEGKKVACVLSGGNIDVTILSRIIDRGLLMSGRSCQFTLQLSDRPGLLHDVSGIVAGLGANIVAVHHERVFAGADVSGCHIIMTLQTRNFEHIDAIREALTNAGIKVL
ncbi:MAG: threonine ammonia-lyase [Clostridia bacterium]|nr:threonine ammonia-lyase [Clostridia bacterium]